MGQGILRSKVLVAWKTEPSDALAVVISGILF